MAEKDPQRAELERRVLEKRVLAKRQQEAAANAPPEEENSPLMSGVRKYIQGATANFSDEVAGGVEAAGRMVGVKGAGAGPISDMSFSPSDATMDPAALKAAYQLGRNHERESLKKDARDNPGVSAVADLAGMVTSPINRIAKGMSLAKGGMALGGINAYGGSDADTVAGDLLNTAAGVAVGGAVGKAADVASPYIGKAADKVADKFKNSAEWLSARAQGLERGTAKKLGADKVKEIGRRGLDEDVFTIGSSTEDMIAKNEALKKAAMDSRGAAYNKIDEAGASAFNPKDAAKKIEEKVLGGKNPNYEDTKELASALDPHLANILSRGEENIPMTTAQDLVESLGKKAKFDTSRSTTANQVAKDVYHTVRKYINDSADKGAENIGVDGLKTIIETANKDYATGMGAGALLKNKMARETGNKILGLTDVITGAGSLEYGRETGDWTNAAGIMVAKKGLEKYGAKVGARALDKIAKTLATSPQMTGLIQKNPGIIQAIVSSLEGKQNSLPAAADNNKNKAEKIADVKGPDKWAVDGYAKLVEHNDSGPMKNPLVVKKMFSTPQGKQALISASDLTPGSKAMERLHDKIQKDFTNGDK